MKNNKLLAGAVLAGVLAVSGCSSIVRGAHEKVEIVSSPPSALCKIYRESSGYLKSVATPGAVYIPRSSEPIKVVCTKDGYESTSVVAAPGTNGSLIGNAAVYGYYPVAAIGMGIDVANGANHELPDVIAVNLPRKN